MSDTPIEYNNVSALVRSDGSVSIYKPRGSAHFVLHDTFDTTGKELAVLRADIARLTQERDAAQAAIAEAIGVLKPLAEPAQYYKGPHDTADTMIVCYYSDERGNRKGITIGDSQRAAAWLAAHPAPEAEQQHAA